MSYSKDREEFVHLMAGPGFGLSLDAIRRLLRDAGIIQRGAEVSCSVDLGDGLTAHEAKMDRAKERVRALWLSRFPEGVVRCHGDPRGACVKLQRTKDDRGDSWGADGWCVPANGYSAAQMDRMTR